MYTELASWWPLLSSPEDYVEEAAFYEQMLVEACERHPHTLLEFGVWIGGVLMALTLVREYFATGLSARIFDASLLGGVVAAVVGGAVFGALAWRQSGRMEKTSPV